MFLMLWSIVQSVTLFQSEFQDVLKYKYKCLSIDVSNNNGIPLNANDGKYKKYIWKFIYVFYILYINIVDPLYI